MDKCKKGCTDECFELENEEYGLEVKCKNKGIFNLEKNRYLLCIEYTTLVFNADMGYIDDSEKILKSPNGTKYKIVVDDSGNLTTTSL